MVSRAFQNARSFSQQTDQNRIINGNFAVWQRGTSHSGTGYGSVDRWRFGLINGSATCSRQEFTNGTQLGTNTPTYYARLAVSGHTGAATDFCHFQQRIEGVNSYAGQTITVLGWVNRQAGAGNMVVNTIQDFGTGGSPSAQVSQTGTTVVLTPSVTPFAVTIDVPNINGKTIGTAGDDWLGLDFILSAGSNFDARANSLGTQTITVNLWGIHILLGTHDASEALNYREKSYGEELQACQRYYESGTYYEAAGVTNSAIVASFYTYVRFSVRKRATPTMTGTNTVGTFATTSTTSEKSGVGRSDTVANRVNAGTFAADAEL